MAKEYKITLTEEQKQLIRDAKTEEEVLAAYQRISVLLAEEQLGKRGLDNVWDDSGVRIRSDALPEDAAVAMRFPGIDPRGHYGAIDMKFAERMARINDMLAMRTDEACETVDTIRSSSTYKRLAQEVERVAKEQRTLTRAERICAMLVSGAANDDDVIPAAFAGEDEETAKMHRDGAAFNAPFDLRKQASSKHADASIVEMDQIMQGLELLVGIRSGVPTKEVQDFYQAHKKDFGGADLSPSVLESCRKVQAPDAVEITHPFFLNTAILYEASKPENWHRQPQEFVKLSPDEIAALVDPYLRATEGRVLDALYGGVERQTQYEDNGGTLHRMDRADYIIVQGKTVKEHLREMFEAGRFGATSQFGGDFDVFYSRQGHQRTAEFVGAALTVDDRVEAFIPDGNGNIPEKPAKLISTGFDVAKFDKTTLNVWERFWSRFGFYRDKVARAEKRAVYDAAYDRVRARHESAQISAWDSATSEHAKDEFFNEWKVEHRTSALPTQTARDYRVDRSAWTTFATLHMLNKGYELADILDPDKLRSEKQAAGKEVIAGMSGGDVEFEKKLFRDGADNYIRQINKMAEKFDFTKPETFASPELRPLLRACYMGYDAHQEVLRLSDQLGRQDAMTISGKFERFGVLSKMTELLYSSKAAIVGGQPTTPDYTRDFRDYFAGTAAVQLIGQEFAQRARTAKITGQPYTFSDVFSRGFSDRLTRLTTEVPSELYTGMGDALRNDPKKGSAIYEAVRSGRLMRETKVKDERGVLSFDTPIVKQPKPEKGAAPMMHR